MSKYIITKDLNKYRFNDNVNVEKYINIKDNILKQADSIEELCDHLVVIEKGSSLLPHIQYRFLGDLFLDHSYDEKFQQNKLIVYGAIWTDKGLIYVAEMKGILPNGEIDWKLL